MRLPQARSQSLFNSRFTVMIDQWMNGIKVTEIGDGRVLQMGLFHYNTFKVCLLSLQYNPVGVVTLFIYFFSWLCMSARGVLLTATPTTGAPGTKRPGPCHHLHACQCCGSAASERGHYRHNWEEFWYQTTQSHQASAVVGNVWGYQHANRPPLGRPFGIECVSAYVHLTEETWIIWNISDLHISVFNSTFKWLLWKI